jgi:ATP-binding cassette, subfamily B, bacterial MsbA
LSLATHSPNLDAREKYRRDKKNNAHFWRALRYLRPYRPMVAASIICAFFVGLAMTSGLGSMLPIIRVLINGDTVPAWMDRTIVNKRLNVKLSDDAVIETLRLTAVAKNGPAWDLGYRAGDVLVGDKPPPALLVELADPNRKSITLHPAQNRDVELGLKPVPDYLVWGQAAAARLPIGPVRSVAVIFGLLFALAGVGNVIRFFQEYLSNKAAILAVNDIRRHLYDHVLRIPLSHFGEEGTSDVTSRLVQDAANLQDGFKQVIGQTIQEPIKVVMAFMLALAMSWQLTLFIILCGPILAVIVRKFGKKMRRAMRKALQESATMLGQLEATLIGIRVVKAAAAERFERRRYSAIMQDLVEQQLRMSRIDAYSTPTMEMLFLLVAGFVVLFGTYLVLVKHTLESDGFILVMVSLVTIAESLRRISKVSNALQQSNAAAARIFEAMDLPVEQARRERRAGLKKLRPLGREIRFEDVTFSYPNSSALALGGINLAVPKGKCLAIVGRNGSGKTTLLALLPRFYDPLSGRISIDGTDIRGVTLSSLRRQISVVTQDSVIFPGTIAQNIAYGHPLAGKLDRRSGAIVALRQEIEKAARQSFAHDFIMEKSGGYDAVLGELGGQLSGGQKQRICIARAILRNSPILILDEATSQVDAESERLIQQAIESLMHQGRRTTFVIAHRLSTIHGADGIVVLERGQIVGEGKHDELLRTCPTYQQLYERQLYAAPTASAAAPMG